MRAHIAFALICLISSGHAVKSPIAVKLLVPRQITVETATWLIPNISQKESKSASMSISVTRQIRETSFHYETFTVPEQRDPKVVAFFDGIGEEKISRYAYRVDGNSFSIFWFKTIASVVAAKFVWPFVVILRNIIHREWVDVPNNIVRRFSANVCDPYIERNVGLLLKRFAERHECRGEPCAVRGEYRFVRVVATDYNSSDTNYSGGSERYNFAYVKVAFCAPAAIFLILVAFGLAAYFANYTNYPILFFMPLIVSLFSIGLFLLILCLLYNPPPIFGLRLVWHLVVPDDGSITSLLI